MRSHTSSESQRDRSLRRAAAAGLALACLLLQGCGNVYEHIAEDEWRAAGTNAPPASAVTSDFAVSLLAHGTGAEVRAGDLVYARVRVFRPSTAPIPAEPEAFNAWIWSGTSPTDEPDIPDRSTWADLGSPGLRATLVGRSVGDRYSVTLEKDAQRSAHRLPLYGLADGSSLEPRYHASSWPVLKVDRRPAEIEILDACAGRLLRRTAVLSQWGPVIHFFDSYNPTSRMGTLGWTALEGDCAAPRGKVRFEIGPLYVEQHMLLDWESSYQRTHFKDSWLGVAVRLLIGAAAFAVTFGLSRSARPATD